MPGSAPTVRDDLGAAADRQKNIAVHNIQSVLLRVVAAKSDQTCNAGKRGAWKAGNSHALDWEVPLGDPCAAETYDRRSNDLTSIWKLFER
jgi:hypothetical protein